MEKLTHQPPFEKRILALMPHELEQRLLVRKASLNGSRKSKDAGKEIVLMERRLNLLREDMGASSEEIRGRRTAIAKELAHLDETKNYDWFLRESLSIRLRLLHQRTENLRSLGPIISVLEHKAWKKEQWLGGKALSPQEWEQLSPRLVSDPQAKLEESEEYRWYLSTLSEHKRKEVDSLAGQIKPIGDDVRAVVCIPTYKEGGNIYRTLSNYLGQKEMPQEGVSTTKAFDCRKLRIVVFDNYPEGANPDQTQAEVRRFIKDHPEIPVDYVKAQFTKDTATIGHIRNMLAAAVIARSLERKNPKGELIYISNDGDMPQKAINPTYVADIIHEFDTHPNMDALAGKIDMPESQMAQLPVQLATRRLWQYMDSIYSLKVTKQPFLVGRNSAIRLKMVAAVGNYDPRDRAGEDVEIGNKIKWIRSWDPKLRDFNKALIRGGKFQSGNRIRYVSRISMDTDPRRDIFRLICGERIKTQYSQFERNKDLRTMQTDDLIQEAINKGHKVFNRALFELEAGQIYYDSLGEEKGLGIEGRIDTFTRAMALLGAKWEIKNGKFKLTDTTKLEENIWLLQFRQLHQRKVEEWLGTKLKSIGALRSDNNRVLTAETLDGNKVIIRTSSQNDRNKFLSEKMILDLLRRNGIPVPRIIALDTTKTIIPDRTIFVCERLPGETLNGDPTKNKIAETSLLIQIGSVLKRIHEIEVGRGFGFIDEQGNGTNKCWEEFVLKPFHSERLTFLVDRGFISKADLIKAINFANSNRFLLDNCPRKLLHGDFALSNILQKDNKLVAVIDFENAKAGDPLWDIAHFVVYERDRIGGDKGVQALLNGYGNPNLLSDPKLRFKYYLYKLSDILYGLEWYSYRPHRFKDIEWLNKQLNYTLQRIESSYTIYEKKPEKGNQLHPISRSEVATLLQARYTRAVEWFKNFYCQGLPNDQEFVTGAQRYKDLQPVLITALQKGDKDSKEKLFEALKKDPQIVSSGFSDKELRRQIDRLVLAYKTNPSLFKTIDRKNPAFRAIIFLRNRGKLERYEREYSNLPKEINFRQIALDLARRKLKENKVMNILDEGGTLDVALQQLTGAILYHVPGLKVNLASIAADNMAKEFADCHKFSVDHRMADIHRLNEVFEGEKRTLIISQATYKFLWDPVGAIVQTSNALENGGWAFIGDLRDKVSYNLFEMFRDQKGNPIHPKKVIDYLNSLNLGYKFYVGIHTSKDKESRQVMTIAVKKETNKDLVLPISYKRIDIKSDWQSPLVYILHLN